MIRTILIPENKDLYLHIPESYVGKKLEVIVFVIDEVISESKKFKMADFWGTISNETAAELHNLTNEGR